MQKNRAIWVVIAVIAVAAILMYFVVMPQLKDNTTVSKLAGQVEGATKKATEDAKAAADKAKAAADEAAKQAADAAKAAADEAAKTVDQAKDGFKTLVLDKVGRVKTDANSALDGLKALYASGQAPAAADLEAAKAKIKDALKLAAELKAPEGTEAALGGLVTTLSDSANKAIAAIDALPADAAGATAAIDAIKTQIDGAIGAIETGLGAKVEDAAKAATDTAAAVTQELPAFDVLRVEKDGSTVIAGRAKPESKLEIVDGATVIATTDVSPEGDFAAVLDNPLSPGDHQIVLKITGKDGTVLTSEEVATVSVPKDAAGELLAMVSKPGEASRIITAPEAAAKTATETAAATTTTNDAATAETATADATKPAIELPKLPDASSTLATTAPLIGDTAAADKTGTDAAATQDADTTKADAGQVETAQADTSKSVATKAEIMVSAVEIEGDKLFVAGNAKAGVLVRVYADDVFVGEAKADENGHFVVDNTMVLAVGPHTIRADVISADGSKVDFRASVPFDRPAGEQVAVVADPNANGVEAAMVPEEVARFEAARADASKALALLGSLFADGKVPSAEELAAARSASEIALKALAELKTGGSTTADAVIKGAADALAALKALPADANGVKAGLDKLMPSLAGLMPAATAVQTSEVSSEPAVQDGAATDKTQAAADTKAEVKTEASADASGKATEPVQSADTATPSTETPEGNGTVVADPAKAEQPSDGGQVADGTKVIEQAPLKQSDTSVIIRRGDTLWHISRRVYGKGVRYTTIYLANQDQIADPDKIQPGQVFGVPDKPLPNAEELHRNRVLHHNN